MSKQNSIRMEELFAFKSEALEALNEVEMGLVAVNLGQRVTENFEHLCRFMHGIHAGAKMNGLNDLAVHVNSLFAFVMRLNGDKLHRSDCVYYLLSGCKAVRDYFEGRPLQFKYLDNPESMKVPDEVVEYYKNAFNRFKQRSQSKGLVMIVDDEPDMASLLEKDLEDCHFTVEAFQQGEKLLQRIASNVPDLIVSDYNMPGMNGLELLKRVHKQNPEIPVIFVSAFLTKEVVIEALSNGAYGFLEKPVNEVQLMLMIETAVARDKATKLINRSLNFLKYHFAEISKILKEQGKTALYNSIKLELDDIIRQKARLNDLTLADQETPNRKAS